VPTRLPPLNALRAFEAAARHLSFRKAAAELFVTPTAISHQVKALEAHLSVRLFNRLPRGLALTLHGAALLPRLTQGFELLREASDALSVRREERRTLSIDAPLSFATKWLTPRLARFVAAHPQVALSINAVQRLIEPGLEGGARTPSVSDLAMVFGGGDVFPGAVGTALFPAELLPYCSPALRDGTPPLRSIEDLRRHTLLHDDTSFVPDGRSNWTAWLDHSGIEGVDATRGIHFSHATLAMDGAIDGLGVVLSLPPLAAHDVETGRLVCPFGPGLKLGTAYTLVIPDVVAERREVRQFRDWLLATVAAEAGGTVTT
jgi:LysR family glycine cleavage system transcriptional activator